MATLALDALRSFTLTAPPAGFADDSYPWYAALRRHSPVHPLAAGAWLLTRHDDVDAVYRSAAASSDKQREFGPRYGVATPLYGWTSRASRTCTWPSDTGRLPAPA